MSARFVYWMNVSLDLFVERTPGENTDLPGPAWVRIDEQLHRAFNERARALSMLVQGRVVWDLMDPFWPDARSNTALPDYLREYGEIWTSKPKVLVSRSRSRADHNTTVVGDPAVGSDALVELARLRREGAGDIGVGGVSIATQLLEAGLLDELVLYTHPALVGAGRPLFDGYSGLAKLPVQLDLLESDDFDSGVTMRRYGIRAGA